MKRRILPLAALVLAALASPAPSQKAVSGQPQIGDFGFDATGMDRSGGPGDDLAGYANGGCIQRTEIPADRASYGMFDMLDDLSRARSREILEAAAKQPSSK